MTDWLNPPRPYSIAHRGASAYAPDCSLEAYEKAARLGADVWEVDIRSSSDGVLITYHDATLPDGTPIGELTAEEIAAMSEEQGVPAVPFEEVLHLAKAKGAGIYADIKDLAATLPTLAALKAHGIEKAILGAFNPEAARLLDGADCPYPRSVLVPIGVDPFDHARGADVIHLCWEHMDRPQDLLDPAFFAEADRRGQKVVLWHEEDPDRMATLRTLPVLGICSDRPELVHPFRPPADWPVGIVCHRGATEFAPENTVEAAHCAFAAGFDIVELDVHQTRDGALAVIHDVTFDRTTDGRGAVQWASGETLSKLDAGSWYTPHFRGHGIPSLDEILAVAKGYGGGLYVELKSADPGRVLDAVTRHSMLDHCFFWSFNHSKLAEIRKLSADARLMVRRQDYPTLDLALADLSPEVVEFATADDLTEFSQCRAGGAKPMIAYMGRDPATFDRIVEAKPDLVNLHFPFAFRDHLQNTPPRA
ncbi:MAG: glycerophosphodiester phosphodiesterase family protein [Pseudomonadota bacterium]